MNKYLWISLWTVLAIGINSCGQSAKQPAEPAAEHTHDHGENGHEHSHSDEEIEGVVVLSQEQQDMLDIKVTDVSRRTLYENIPAPGEVKAAQFAESEVFAPFDGVLMPDPEHGMVRPGETVRSGEILARIAPTGGTESGWTQIINDYRLTKSEYDRVKRLSDSGAAPQKRLEEATLAFESSRARMRAALGVGDVDVDRFLDDSDHYHLKASRPGVLTDIHLRYGQRVSAGEHLLSVIDPSVVWIEAQVSSSEAAHVRNVDDAYFIPSGVDTILRVSELNGKLISASILLDPATRRLPIIFEVENVNGFLQPGAFAQVFLKTNESRDALAIPVSSVLNEDGSSVVYVQGSTTSFEKRIIQTGAKDEGYVEVLSGLGEGERIAFKGAPKIRLAALKVGSASDSHGHSH